MKNLFIEKSSGSEQMDFKPWGDFYQGISL